jgi:hypothetical protein
VRARGTRFEIDIDGAKPLRLSMEDITLEGANTSFQVHWRISPADYADTFNAVQLLTPVVLALSANSPGIFGSDLWDETRIPLFKQSIDTRHTDPRSWHAPARVSMGQGWVRDGAHELFEESVRLFPALLPCCSTSSGRSQGAPELAELRLHQSTVWLWNRPVYDDADGGHLRIELRSLPAGPTAVDMVAGAAFILGAAQGLKREVNRLLPGLPFSLAERNFYRAAQWGITADLIWPQRNQHGLALRPIVDVAAELLPVAARGLRELQTSEAEIDKYLGVIERRIATGQTGARWQRRVTEQGALKRQSRDEALANMLARYRDLSASNSPVADWPV